MSDRHGHDHLENGRKPGVGEGILAIRCQGGLSGDMFLTGLCVAAMAGAGIEPGTDEADAWLDGVLARIMPCFAGIARIRPKLVGGIAGWHLYLDLPASHEHRGMAEICEIIAASGMEDCAKERALACFGLLAQCEAAAHQKPVSEVHFHEVGALDSILDICGVCSVHVQLGTPAIACSPLPLADGSTQCQHGLLPAPAPAVLQLLENIPVVPFAGDPCAGELVTPTALALLRTLGAEFGPWPAMLVRRAWLVYGGRVFANAVNGAMFAFGSPL